VVAGDVPKPAGVDEGLLWQVRVQY